jgi:hypothetical protein
MDLDDNATCFIREFDITWSLRRRLHRRLGVNHQHRDCLGSAGADLLRGVEYRFALLYNHRFTASYAPDWKIFKSTLEEQKSLMPISTVLSRNITIPRWTAHASARSQASRSRSETRSPSVASAAR